MIRRLCISILLLYIIVLSNPASALIVPCCNVSSIYAALQDASQNEIVELASGTYTDCPYKGVFVNASVTLIGNETTISCTNNASYSFSILLADMETLILDNLTFSGAAEMPALSVCGGSYVLRNCMVSNNIATAVVVVDARDVTILDSIIVNNTCDGAQYSSQGYYYAQSVCDIFTVFARRLIVQEVLMLNNSVVNGGTLSCTCNIVEVENVTVIANGRALSLLIKERAHIFGSTFKFNTADISDIQISGPGGDDANVFIKDCMFSDHRLKTPEVCEKRGACFAGIGAESIGHVSIENTSFERNEGGCASTIAMNSCGFVAISGCTFANNTSSESTVYLTYDPGSHSHRGLTQVELHNNIFVGNTATNEEVALIGPIGKAKISFSLFSGLETDMVLNFVGSSTTVIAIDNVVVSSCTASFMTCQGGYLSIIRSNFQKISGVAIDASSMTGVTVAESTFCEIQGNAAVISSDHVQIDACEFTSINQLVVSTLESAVQVTAATSFVMTNSTIFGVTSYEDLSFSVTSAWTDIVNCSFANSPGGIVFNGGTVNLKNASVQDLCFGVKGVGVNMSIIDATFISTIMVRALTVLNGDLTLNNVMFADNFAGALFLNQSSADIIACQFTQNVSPRTGGAIHADASDFYVMNSIFDGNTANSFGGAVSILGRGAFDNCQIMNNLAYTSGGGVCVLSGEAIISTTTLNNSSAPLGADVMLYEGDLLWDNSSFETVTNQSRFVCEGGSLKTNAHVDASTWLSTSEFDCTACGCCQLYLPSLGFYNVSSFGGAPFLPNITVSIDCGEQNVNVTCVGNVGGVSYFDVDGESSCFSECAAHCMGCSLEGHCVGCEEGFTLTDDATGCEACPTNCAQCTSSAACTSCTKGYVLDSSTSSCIPCQTGCGSCINDTSTCTSCVGTFQYDDTRHDCQDCGAACVACAACATCALGFGNCTKCQAGFDLIGTSCVPPPSGSPDAHHTRTLLIAVSFGVGAIVVTVIIGGACWWRRRGRRKGYRELTEISQATVSSVSSHRAFSVASSTGSMRRGKSAGLTTVNFSSERSDENVTFTLNASEVGLVAVEDLTILSPLGEGGQGTVFHVQHNKTFTEMALKIVTPESSTESIAMALDEVKVLINLHHPHCLPYLGICQWEGKLGILTEYMSAGDLSARGPSMLMPQKLRALTQAAKGLAYLHLQDILHSDLKPSNIFLDENGRTVLGDFGLAGTVQPRGMTRAFAAPEVLLGQPAVKASDIFSFGATCISVITDESPVSRFAATDAPFAPIILSKLEARLNSTAVNQSLVNSIKTAINERSPLGELLSGLLRLQAATPS